MLAYILTWRQAGSTCSIHAKLVNKWMRWPRVYAELTTKRRSAAPSEPGQTPQCKISRDADKAMRVLQRCQIPDLLRGRKLTRRCQVAQCERRAKDQGAGECASVGAFIICCHHCDHGLANATAERHRGLRLNAM